MHSLGTDGFGRSDTRERLRRFFEVDRDAIVLAALSAVDRSQAGAFRSRSGVDTPAAPAWTR
jgi:pyruvate dehydrogenase E1 component